MITKYYTVIQINGDYSILQDDDMNEISIARFLLPLEIEEGSKLLYKNLEYTLV